MKRNILKKLSVFSMVITLAVATLTGCGQPDTSEVTPPSTPSSSEIAPSTDTSSAGNTGEEPSSTENAAITEGASVLELYVKFGDDGAPFTMHLYDNDTAAAIAHHVGTADWRIPLYNYEGYDNWEVMQYYDIPSRYEIPSNAEAITEEVAGAVYYSEPNRIVLFYGDAEVSGEYTPVGYFEATSEFISAVENNPVLDGWSNKIIQISAEE